MAGTAKPKTPTKKQGAKPTGKPSDSEEMRSANQFWSIVIFALGILFLLLSLISGSSGWYGIHTFLRGLFGTSVFLVAPVMIYAAVMIAMDKSQNTVLGKVIQCALLILLVSGAMQIFAVGSIEGENLSQKFSVLFSDGQKLRGGGLASALIGLPLLLVFGRVGASIIISLLFFVIIMLLTNITLFDFFGLFYKPLRKAASAMKETCTDTSSGEGADGSSRKQGGKKSAEPRFEYDIPLPADKSAQSTKKGRKQAAGSFEFDIPLNNKKSAKRGSFEYDIPIPSYPVLDSDEKRAIAQELTTQPEPDINALSEAVNAAVGKDKAAEEIAPAPVKVKPQKVEKDGAQSDLDDIIAKAATAVKPAKVSQKAEQEAVTAEMSKELSAKLDGALVPKSYIYPSTELLKHYDNTTNRMIATEEMKQNSEKLVDVLRSFNVETRIVGIHRGPTVTRYEIQPAAGVKVSKITSLSDDIALNLAADGVRIEAPIPNKSAVGIEVPNRTKDIVSFRELMECDEFTKIKAKSKLAIAIGSDIEGNMIVGDVAKMPHVIVAGTTGSGKSVCTGSMIMSILYNASPEDVRLVLIDPKLVEFPKFNGIPHLLIPVVTDPNKAAGALNWAVNEMLRRYQLFSDCSVSNIEDYNRLAEKSDDGMEKIPKIVIAIDELADLMMAAKNDVETAICRLAQMARAAGMHLIIATQRPTVDVVTGLIKANIPSRIALKTFSKVDSMTILDMAGSDKLLGNGDMLYFPTGYSKPLRVQGCFCSTEEINSVVAFIKSSNNEASYNEEIQSEIDRSTPVPKGEKSGADSAPEIDPNDDEAVLERAIDVVVEMGQASTTNLQKKLKLGYARASRIMDELEEMGVVGPYEGAKPRRVLMTKQQWAERRMRGKE